MKKTLLFIAFFAFLTGEMIAGPVDAQRAQQLGKRFLSTTALVEQKTDIQLNLAFTSANRDAVDYYVFNVRGNNGFVIVAGDDRVKPILAYSTKGSFDPEDIAEGFEFMLNSFSKEIQYVREHHLPATPDIVTEWASVLATGGLKQGRSARAVVGPLCQTIWNQNFPYSSQCPEDEEGSGGHVYAGCVATAMGQVMKYHDYPEQGIGSHTYNPSGYAQQTANFGETDYHFELMPLSLDSTSTEEDYFYIAQFLHHCGIAVNMQYSGHGSGAYSSDVPPALRNYFGYTCDDDEMLGFWGWNFYSNEEWAQMLKDGGLDEHLPLYYSGADDNGQGGHAFVCDGYDENDYFHFNWGWSGRDDAWCPIGALNTTKYAFNDQNSFIGHIIPNDQLYNQRADSVAGMQVVEIGDYTGVALSWVNPSLNLNGDALSSIESITIRRNNQVIATLTDVQEGASMTYEDNNLEPGLYEYAILVTNEAGFSRANYRSVLVGEKCDVTFQLSDQGGDGWKGAAISVTAENGQRIAVISMNEGSEMTVTVPLLKQNLNFIWNHGWYHTNEQYDTDYECMFSIYDAYGDEIYVSGQQLVDGIFMTYENNCEEGALTCYPVRNLQGVYQWQNAEEYGAYLTWDKPLITSRLDHFVIYSNIATKTFLAEIPYTGASSYEYLDLVDFSGACSYSVTSVYVKDEESCESEEANVVVTITEVNESMDEAVKLYPNPTTGIVTVEGNGHLTVLNVLGQTVQELDLDGQTTIELPKGLFFMRINGLTKKVVVE